MIIRVLILSFILISCHKKQEVYADYEGYKNSKHRSYSVDSNKDIAWVKVVTPNKYKREVDNIKSFHIKTNEYIEVKILSKEPGYITFKVFINGEQVYRVGTNCKYKYRIFEYNKLKYKLSAYK